MRGVSFFSTLKSLRAEKLTGTEAFHSFFAQGLQCQTAEFVVLAQSVDCILAS